MTRPIEKWWFVAGTAVLGGVFALYLGEKEIGVWLATLLTSICIVTLCLLLERVIVAVYDRSLSSSKMGKTVVLGLSALLGMGMGWLFGGLAKTGFQIISTTLPGEIDGIAGGALLTLLTWSVIVWLADESPPLTSQFPPHVITKMKVAFGLLLGWGGGLMSALWTVWIGHANYQVFFNVAIGIIVVGAWFTESFEQKRMRT